MTHERLERGSNRIRTKILLSMIAFLLMSSVPFFSQSAEARPSMSLVISLSDSNLEPTDVFTCTIFFNNTGESVASLVWINVSFPDHVKYMSDSSNIERGFKTGDYNWTFPSIGISDHKFGISLQIAQDVDGEETLMILGHLDYLGSSSVSMPSLTAHATFKTGKLALNLESQAPSDPKPPVRIVKGIATSNSTASFNGLRIPVGHETGSSALTDFNDEINVTDDRTKPPPPNTDLNESVPGEIGNPPTSDADSGEIPETNQSDLPDIAPVDRTYPVVTMRGQDIREVELQTESYVNHVIEEEDDSPKVSVLTHKKAKPSLVSSEIVSNNRVYNTGDILSFTIFINNTGSRNAKTVWVDISIPITVRYINDTSSLIGGKKVGDLSYVFTNIGPGNHEFLIFFSFEGEAEDTTEVEVWAHVSYTDSQGDFVGGSSHKASCSVIPQSEQFPLLQVSIAVLSAGLVSIMAFSTNKLGINPLLPFFAPLYSRLKRREVLDHEARGVIIDHIKDNPGEHFNSIKSKLDFRNGTLAHHLHVLERERVIKSVKYGKYRRFFPMGMAVSRKAYPTELEQEILDVVRRKPGINQKSIAKKVDKSKSTVNYHIDKLRKCKIIRTEKNGLSLRHYIVDPDQ